MMVSIDYLSYLSFHEEAIKANPNDYLAYINYGNALQELKRFDDSVVCYDYAIKINPSYAESFLRRGMALKNLNRSQEALADFKYALTLKPNHKDKKI